MHAVSTNQIADILHFNDNNSYNDDLTIVYQHKNVETTETIE